MSAKVVHSENGDLETTAGLLTLLPRRFTGIVAALLTVEANGMVANFANTRKGKGCIARIQFAVCFAIFPGARHLQKEKSTSLIRAHPTQKRKLTVQGQGSL